MYKENNKKLLLSYCVHAKKGKGGLLAAKLLLELRSWCQSRVSHVGGREVYEVVQEAAAATKSLMLSYSLPSKNVNPWEWIKVNIYRGVNNLQL